MELLGDRRATDEVAALQHAHLQAGAGEIGGADQAVVAAADDEDIVVIAITHAGTPRGLVPMIPVLRPKRKPTAAEAVRQAAICSSMASRNRRAACSSPSACESTHDATINM